MDKISTGRPLFKAAFANIISDLRIWKLYETEYIGRLISLEAAKIQKLEEELEKIYKIGKVDGRIDYVSQKIEASNKRFWIWKSKLLMLQAIRVNPMANHFRYQVLKRKQQWM